MSRFELAWRSLAEHPFRSWAAATCAGLIASFALLNSLVLGGAQASLRLAQERLGADILVAPQGAGRQVEGALLMGITGRVWMPRATLARVAAVPGVAQASPQIYLSTLTGAECCSVADMFLIVYDPATDFTLRPWLEHNLEGGLRLGEVVGGRYVFTPQGEQNISIYGYLVTLAGNLEPTGTGLDQSMFLSLETAEDIARMSGSLAEQPLEIPPDSISTVLVRVAPGADPREVARRIEQTVSGASAIPRAELFGAYGRQIDFLLRSLLAMLGVTLLLSLFLLGLIFSIAANERRREMGVLRALGARRSFVWQALLAEAGLLAVAGGLGGALLTSLAVFLFRHLLITSLGIPFILPAPLALTGQLLAGVGLALASTALGCLLPAYRASRVEPAEGMRE